jgi:hypothetical protein
MTLEEDVTWIMERCPKLNSLAVLEPSAQAIAIMLAIGGNNPFNEQEMAKLSLVGIIAMHCRKIDEERFQTLSPYAYLQIANAYIDENDTSGVNYKELVNKIKNIIKLI